MSTYDCYQYCDCSFQLEDANNPQDVQEEIEVETTSMTYGTLPTWDEFEAAFDRECPRGTYNIRLAGDDSESVEGFKLGGGDWTSAQLWSAINEVVVSDGDMITISEDDEYENVYQVLYPGTDRPLG